MLTMKVLESSISMRGKVIVTPAGITAGGKLICAMREVTEVTKGETTIKVKKVTGTLYAAGGAAIGSLLGPAGTIAGGLAGAAFGGVGVNDTRVQVRFSNHFINGAMKSDDIDTLMSWAEGARAAADGASFRVIEATEKTAEKPDDRPRIGDQIRSLLPLRLNKPRG